MNNIKNIYDFIKRFFPYTHMKDIMIIDSDRRETFNISTLNFEDIEYYSVEKIISLEPKDNKIYIMF